MQVILRPYILHLFHSCRLTTEQSGTIIDDIDTLIVDVFGLGDKKNLLRSRVEMIKEIMILQLQSWTRNHK